MLGASVAIVIVYLSNMQVKRTDYWREYYDRDRGSTGKAYVCCGKLVY